MLAPHDNWPTRLRFARLMLAANLQRLSALLADFVLEMFECGETPTRRVPVAQVLHRSLTRFDDKSSIRLASESLIMPRFEGEGEAFTGNW